MKKIFNIGLPALLLTGALMVSSCSDSFLEDKKNYGNYVAEDIYNDYTSAKLRVETMYNYMLPQSNQSVNWRFPSSGSSDIFSKSTEEYGGFSDFTDPNVHLDYNNIIDLFHNELKIRNSPWAFLREVNDILEGLEKSSLPAEQKNQLMGQMYFWRGWIYYRLVTIYGGVPIITKAQDAYQGDSGGTDIIVPRSTTKACIDFMCADLDKAASLLPSSWGDGAFGHVTKGTAMALKGRILLFWASPLFNRTNDNARWEAAYQANLAAKNELEAAGFGLAYESNPGVNGAGWARMFLGIDAEARKEFVFATLYNTLDPDANDDIAFNNTWENSIRPSNTDGGGGKEVTAQMVDLFPMGDGSRPTLANGYDPQLFFVNRDPRFYRTFSFSGETWWFDGTPKNYSPTSYTYPYDGKEYRLWNYCWYKDAAKQTDSTFTGKATDGVGKGCVYLRKKCDDYGVNSSATYVYTTTNAFKRSGAPHVEMRFAEVLLNLAESAAGCGGAHDADAMTCLQRIRTRAGIPAGGNNYGLGTGLTGPALIEAVLYERRVELCYEGKRYDDCRRWLLWDGGATQGTLKASWVPSGFGGNTCQWLGVTPLIELGGKGTQGEGRRQGIEIRLNTTQTADQTDGADKTAWPAIYNARPVPLDINKDGVVVTTTAAGTPGDTPMDQLKAFYQTYLTRKTIRVDGDEMYKMEWKPEYYFIGFTVGAAKANVTLPCNLGWLDYNTGAMGTFDPLAE